MKFYHYIIVFIIFFSACKPNKYPDLQDGIYADVQTSLGDVLIELYYKETPMTVANFVSLSEGNHTKIVDSLQGKPFYDNMKFHRVVDDFMIQTGKPKYTHKEDVGYFFANELNENLLHDSAGVVSMANLGKPFSNSTQFFITHKATPWLNGFEKGKKKPCGKYGIACHTVFGKVIKGQDVVNIIKQNDVINHIEIIRVGKDADVFDAPKIFAELSEASVPFDIKMGIEKATETSSGLKFLQLKKGSALKVNPALQTTAHYALYNMNGQQLASSFDKNKPITFTVDKDPIIAGWKEAVKLMYEGEKARLFVPSYLAYGTIGSDKDSKNKQLVKPNEDLIFEIEILKVGK